MDDLLLVGGGGHCNAVIEVIEKCNCWNISGVVDSNTKLSAVLGYPVIGVDDDLPKLARHIPFALVTVGQIKTSAMRVSLYTRLKDAGFSLATIASPLSDVSRRATICEGSVIMNFAHVGPGARIGCNTIINTRALVEHGSVIGDHCHISTCAIINGDVRIGDGTFIGSGAIIREGITIGSNCIIAMGAVVRSDIQSHTRYDEGHHR